MAQVSAALKANAGRSQPLPGLRVKHVIAMGESQSAGRLSTYYNTIHPLHRLFDGFVYLDRAGQLRSDLTTPAVSALRSAQLGADGAGVGVLPHLGEGRNVTELKSRYRTHHNYVAQVFASARSAANDGYLLPFDAAQTRWAAIHSDVARYEAAGAAVRRSRLLCAAVDRVPAVATNHPIDVCPV